MPLALLASSVAFDLLGVVAAGRGVTKGMRAAGFWTLVLAAAGSVPAALSGLLMTRGELLGHDLLRLHHLFVWPAFALLLGLAAWRIALRGQPTALYLAVLGLTSVLMGAAGYWGGELMLRTAGERWAPPPPPSPESLAFGRQLYLKRCAHCHAADGRGDEGPDLHGLQVSDRYIANTITRGIKGEMPSFAKKLDAASVVALIGYLRSLDPGEPNDVVPNGSAPPEP